MARKNETRQGGFRNNVKLLLVLVGVCWGVAVINQELFGGRLLLWGLQPRKLAGLVGILTANFLHAGYEHLGNNTVSFLLFGGLVMARGREVFVKVSCFVIVVQGLGLWVFGRADYIVGASGLIFGYFGYLLLLGWFERSFSTVVLSIAVAVLYGGMVFGVLPQERPVAWEGHLIGFAAGILAARRFAPKRPSAEVRPAAAG